jgi:hypothetical protein
MKEGVEMQRGRLSEEEKTEIIKYYRSGEDAAQIARTLDRSYSTVWTYLNRLGLVGDPPAPRSKSVVDPVEEQERSVRRTMAAEAARARKEAKAAEQERAAQAALLPGQVLQRTSITSPHDVRNKLYGIIKSSNSKKIRNLVGDLYVDSTSVEEEDIELIINSIQTEIKELTALKKALTNINEGR